VLSTHLLHQQLIASQPTAVSVEVKTLIDRSPEL
jgi:hypothetical protein